MRKALYIMVAFFSVSFIAACDKVNREEASGVPIHFKLAEAGMTTKGISQTTESLVSGSNSVIIVNATKKKGTAATQKIGYPNTNYDMVLRPETEDASTGRWYPVNTGSTTGNSKWNSWEADYSYEFISYAYSPYTSGTDNAKTKKLLTVTSPTSITVKQPTGYSYGSESTTMVDYLLSHKFLVENGNTKPAVKLLYEHALSLVEIYVLKDPSIDDVRVTSLKLQNFYTQAKLECNNPKLYTDSDYNEWTVSTIGGTSQDGNYVMTSAFNSATKEGGFTVVDKNANKDSDTRKLNNEANPAVMQLIAVPQGMTGSLVPTVKVTYVVNEKDLSGDHYNTHEEESFELTADGLPTQWKSGYRYVYYILVDTGVHITGHVRPWQYGGDLEATILPDIVEDN